MSNKRIVVLDTETTGINHTSIPHKNHRIIEIGAVEILNRRFTGNNFHVYIQPNRNIDDAAFKIHGISNDFLLKKPIFKDIAKKFLQYITNSELIIHNAPFDIGFIEQEFDFLNLNIKKISYYCSIVDTLKMARMLFPGKKNTLDALCSRYKINISHRNLHSAIIDAKLLGKLYLLMTGGQESMFSTNKIDSQYFHVENKIIRNCKTKLKIIYATNQEIEEHEKYIKKIKKISE
ncbi:DNA polymerase III subunit epsilon [Buchnera aphidicola (Pterocomma populeum)]